MNTAVVIMLSNYTHDLATGLMFGSVLAYFVALRVIRGRVAPDELPAWHAGLHRRFRPIVFWTLIAVLGLGVPRMIFYEEYEWLPAAGRDQIVALLAKHVVLVSVTVASLVFFFRNGPRTEAAPKS